MDGWIGLVETRREVGILEKGMAYAKAGDQRVFSTAENREVGMGGRGRLRGNHSPSIILDCFNSPATPIEVFIVLYWGGGILSQSELAASLN